MKLNFLEKGLKGMVQENMNRKRTGPCLHEQMVGRWADEWTGSFFQSKGDLKVLKSSGGKVNETVRNF